MSHDINDSASTLSDLFRREALEHYLRESSGRDILRVSPPWTWLLGATLCALVVTGVMFSIFGHVEINERGIGIIRPTAGVRILNAQSAGTIAEVLVHSGGSVQYGHPILRIDSPQIQGSVLEADTVLQSRLDAFQPVLQSQEALYGQQLANARQRIDHARADVDRCRETLRRSRSLLENMKRVRQEGIFSAVEFDRQEENKATAERQLANAEFALRQATEEAVDLQNRRRTQIWKDRSELAAAKARADSAGLTQRQTLVSAPSAGIVDGLVLRPGDAVHPGDILAKLVPRDSPLGAVAFLSEKDRAYVKEGDGVQLELSQYAYAEYGTLPGRVRCVAAELASPGELHEAFGASPPPGLGTPCFRVEIELLPPPRNGAPLASVRLRTGMLLNARFTLRRQSLISFAIEPLRRWLK